MNAGSKVVLGDTVAKLKANLKSVTGKPCISSEPVEVEEIRSKLIACGDAIQRASTEFHFMADGTMTTEYLGQCCATLLDKANMFTAWVQVAIALSTPSVRKAVTMAAQSLLMSVVQLVQEAAEDISSSQCVGVVKSAAAALQSVPLTAAAATKHVISNSAALLQDAIDELQQELTEANNEGEQDQEDGGEEDEEEDKWTDEQRTMVVPTVLRVLRAAHALTQMLLNGILDQCPDTKIVETMAMCVHIMSPQADDLVDSVYAPQDQEKVMIHLQAFQKTTGKLLKISIGATSNSQAFDKIRGDVEVDLSERLQAITLQ